MLKSLKLLALGLVAILFTTACSDDDGPYVPPVNLPRSGAVIVNQGNAYSGISGSLSTYVFGDSTLTNNVFQAVNHKSVGDNPQYGISYGPYVYLAEFKGNHVWVMTRDSLKVVKEIATPSPEDVTAWGNFLYVANNDGYVTRVNLSTADTTRLYVGPNPSNLLAANNALYVSVSDGWNSTGNYQNGKRVSKINPQTFKVEKEIRVGINPGKMTQDANGDVFVVCRGNYGGNAKQNIAAVEPMIYKIYRHTDTAVEFVKGTDIAILNNKAYVIYNYTNWQTYETTLNFNIYDSSTGKLLKADFLKGEDAPPAPLFMTVQTKTQQLFITSRKSGMNYNQPGNLFVYKNDNQLVEKLNTGVEPYCIFFR